MPKSALWLLRAVALLALCLVLFSAFGPDNGSRPRLMPWDKAEHFTAFFGLTILGLLAFPRQRSWQVAMALAVLGALIEGVQGLPAIHRDSDLRDWIADLAGIGFAIGPTLIPTLRRTLLSSQA
jgi:VanZ family protein